MRFTAFPLGVASLLVIGMLCQGYRVETLPGQCACFIPWRERKGDGFTVVLKSGGRSDAGTLDKGRRWAFDVEIECRGYRTLSPV